MENNALNVASLTRKLFSKVDKFKFIYIKNIITIKLIINI